jgi:hypothetical protein
LIFWREAIEMNDIEKTATDSLYHYGCAMTARGLNKDELTILMRARNAAMGTPLEIDKVDEISESAFMFALKADTNIDLPTITGKKRQLLPLLNEIYDSLRPDIALLSMLMFWTRGDEPRADALFRQSGLNRPKWMNRADYRERCFRFLR